MGIKLPVFQKIKHPVLQKFGVKDGLADEAFMSEAARVTNELIRRKLHVPVIKDGHEGSITGNARGWVEGCEATKDAKLLGDCDFTDSGKQRIQRKEARWFSASFRRDFPVTGDPEGEKIPGVYLDHVALLGDVPPRVKGLVDLTEVKFSDTESIYFSETDGEVVFFAELKPTAERPEGEGDDMSELETLKAEMADKEAKFAEEKQKREAAEARLAEAERKQKRADFAAHVRKVKQLADDAVKAKKFGKEGHEAIIAIGLSQHAEQVANFSDVIAEEKLVTPTGTVIEQIEKLLASLKPVVPGPIAKESEFSDDNEAGLTSADFAVAATDVNAANKIARVLTERQKKDPKFTIADLRREFAA